MVMMFLMPAACPEQAADHHQNQRAEQGDRQLRLVARFAAGDHRGQKDPHGQKGRRSEKEGQLQMPHARKIVGDPLVHRQAVKTVRLDVVVGIEASQQTLGQKQAGDHQEIPGGGALGAGQLDLAGRPKGQVIRLGIGAVPAQNVVASDEEKEQAGASQQGDQAQHAPQHGIGRGRIGGQRLGRPVVGIGVSLIGPRGRGHPGRPGKKSRQPADLFRS
jgi:hypothetical protein